MAAPETIPEVQLKDKYLLTMYEAAAYFGLGINRIAELCRQPNCSFVFYSGTKKLVKRKAFEDFIESNRTLNCFGLKSIKKIEERPKPMGRKKKSEKAVTTTATTD